MTEQKLTYEAARDELLKVVAKLESGSSSLADSMALWQRGEQLADLCQEYLDGARTQVAGARDGGRTQPDA